MGAAGGRRPPTWGARRKWPLARAWGPRCWSAREGSRGCAVDGSQGSGGWGWPGGETPLRSQSWGPLRLSPSGRWGGEQIFAGRRRTPLFSVWGEAGTSRQGCRCLMRGAGPSMSLALFWVSGAAPPTLVCSSFPLWVSQAASSPDPSSTPRPKLTLFLARSCGSRACRCNLTSEMWFLCSRGSGQPRWGD